MAGVLCAHMLGSGADGLSKLTAKVAANGPLVLFTGSLAAWAASVVGYYPWSVL